MGRKLMERMVMGRRLMRRRVVGRKVMGRKARMGENLRMGERFGRGEEREAAGDQIPGSGGRWVSAQINTRRLLLSRQRE